MKIHTLAVMTIAASPESVYTALTTPHYFPAHFRGFGPIPGISHEALPKEVSHYQVGLIRKMYGEDTSVFTEKITEMEYPNLFAYEIISGIGKPLSLLINHGRSVWNFLPHGHTTTIEWHFVFTLTSPVVYPLASVVIKYFMKKAMQRCLASIKTSLEKKIPATA
jgi:hypothetical protein